MQKILTKLLYIFNIEPWQFIYHSKEIDTSSLLNDIQNALFYNQNKKVMGQKSVKILGKFSAKNCSSAS